MIQKRVEIGFKTPGYGDNVPKVSSLGVGVIVETVLIPRGSDGSCACTGYIVKMDDGVVYVIWPEQILSIL